MLELLPFLLQLADVPCNVLHFETLCRKLFYDQKSGVGKINVFRCHYKKRSLELRFGAVFDKNAASKPCLSCVFVKRSSTSAEAAFEMVQAATLGYIEIGRAHV